MSRKAERNNRNEGLLSVWWSEMREEEPPENLEAKMRREHASIRNAVEEMTKPKTLDEMLEEYDEEMAED